MSLQFAGGQVARLPGSKIAKINTWLGFVFAGDHGSRISLHVDDEQVFVPQKNVADVADVVGLLAEVDLGLSRRFLEDAHFMLAKAITLKARGHEFHHERCPASGTAYDVKPFHDVRNRKGHL